MPMYTREIYLCPLIPTVHEKWKQVPGAGNFNLNKQARDDEEEDVQEVQRPMGKDRAKNKLAVSSASSTSSNEDALTKLMVNDLLIFEWTTARNYHRYDVGVQGAVRFTILGNVDSASVIMDLLQEFKLTSGLVPSIPKSTAYFCNVLNHVKLATLNIMPFSEGKLLIEDWKNKSMSFAGRLQLCKSVISLMHVYWASVLILPKSIILDIQQLIRGFLWCNGEYKRGKAKVAWENIYIPPKADMSWGWRKLIQIRDLAKLFFWVQIGNGLDTSVWYDSWCSHCPLIQYLSHRDITREGYHLRTCVSDLVSNGVWIWPQSWLLKAPTLQQVWMCVRSLAGMDVVPLILQDIIAGLQPMDRSPFCGMSQTVSGLFKLWHEDSPSGFDTANSKRTGKCCPPSIGKKVHNLWLFFPFHRWYLYFYKRILEKLINDDTFALPYWNWDDPVGGITIPDFFLLENSLAYDVYRDALQEKLKAKKLKVKKLKVKKLKVKKLKAKKLEINKLKAKQRTKSTL
ncbi:reverse transcriptase domain, reverse transcriptase zinc-binding domain protein [Tanacetum coccineum]